MTHVISIAAPVQKSGKTAAAINLAVSFAVSEKKTLLVDCDPGKGAAYGASALIPSTQPTGFYAVMTDRTGLGDEILASTIDYLKILPAGADFSKADFLFGDTDGDFNKFRDLIQSVKNEFDFIVIDTPSAMPNLLKTILMATDWVLVPINADIKTSRELVAPLSSVKKLLEEIITLHDQFQILPKILGILLNKNTPIADMSDSLTDPVFENIEEFFLSTRIPLDRDLAAGPAFGKPAAFMNIESEATSAFMDLADETIKKINQWTKNS